MSWQDTLWTIPLAMGWGWYALWGALAIVGAGIVFFKLIWQHEFNALLVGRAIFAAGALLIPLAAIQPGWQPWIPAMYAINIFFMGVLLGTRWCERADQSLTMTVALWRWLVRSWRDFGHWLRAREQQREDVGR